MNIHYTSESLSIVIPIYNEEEILEASTNQIIAICEKIKAEYEIILVENGSTDKTARIASNLSELNPNLMVINLTSPNYGNALKEGFMKAKNELVVAFDIDYFSESFLKEALLLNNKLLSSK